MLKKYTPSERKETTYYKLVFDDGHYDGFAFPCDENGNVSINNPGAEQNYKYCLEHPEKFSRFNKVVEYNDHYTEPAVGICECGEEFELHNEFYGACQCPKCGLWYNLFGQELLPPSCWEEDW